MTFSPIVKKDVIFTSANALRCDGGKSERSTIYIRTVFPYGYHRSPTTDRRHDKSVFARKQRRTPLTSHRASFGIVSEPVESNGLSSLSNLRQYRPSDRHHHRHHRDWYLFFSKPRSGHSALVTRTGTSGVS